MFSTSVASGSICIGCQLRAVTRRAAPAAVSATAQARAHNRIRRRQYASQAARAQEDQLVALLTQQRHSETHQPSPPPQSRNPRRKRNGAQRHEHKEDEEDPFPLFVAAEPELNIEVSTCEAAVASEADTILFEDEQQSMDSNESLNTASDFAGLHSVTTDPATPTEAATENTLQGAELETSNEQDTVLVRRTKSRRPLAANDLFVQRHIFAKPGDNTAFAATATDRFSAEKGTVQDLTGTNGPAIGMPFRRLLGDDPQPAKPTKKFFRVRKGGATVVEHNATLSIDTLGQPAEIIVLKEGEKKPWRDYKQDDIPVAPSLRVEEPIDQEEGLDLEIIMENIDGLRPVHRILPTSEFRQVFDTLMNGFKVTQLASYIERFRSRVAEGEESPPLVASTEVSNSRKWIVGQSEWVPGVKGAVRDVDVHLRGYILKSMPPKQRLAMQLMRECWGMAAQELMDGHGFIEVKVRELEWDLLTAGTQRWFQVISRVLLGDGAGKSLQLIKSRKVIRIEAPKVIAEACIEAIDEKLHNVRTRSFKMENFPIQQLTPDMVEDLSKITNSVVQYFPKKKTVQITWIDIAKEPNSITEDLGDIVFRLVLSACPPARTSRTLSISPDTEGKGKLVEDFGSQDKLSWIDRRKKWARLHLPLGIKSQASTKVRSLDENILKYNVRVTPEDLILPSSVYETRVNDFYESLSKSMPNPPLGLPRKAPQDEAPAHGGPKPTTPTMSGWLPYAVRTSAGFGHVLHLKNDDVTQSLQEGADKLDTASSTGAFNPLMPSITGMNLPSWVPYRSPFNFTTTVVLRFVPYNQDPEHPNDPLAPHLELRLKSSDDKIIEAESLRAIAHTNTADILLPGEHVDVRLTQRVVAELPGSQLPINEGMAPLREFLLNSRLDMARGSLKTPSLVENLGLPLWLFYRPEVDRSSQFLSPAALKELPAISSSNRPLSEIFSKAIIPQAEIQKTRTSVKTYKEARHFRAFNAFRPTSYVFAGLELHRPTETSYQGWKLNYTSIQAGQGGGRRAELTLDAVPSRDKKARRKEEEVDARRFMRSVYMLATGAKEEGGRKKLSNSRPTIRWVGSNQGGLEQPSKRG